MNAAGFHRDPAPAVARLRHQVSYPPGEPGYSLADLALGHLERVATLTLIASRPKTPGPVDDDLPGHDDALMEVIMNTPGPDWSDERAVVDHLVPQARTLAGAGAFD